MRDKSKECKRGMIVMHSKKLEETVLWKVYQKKASFGEKRSAWVKEVYEVSTQYLKDVRRIFQNYTLHDETHVLNVMDAMGGLLGDYADKLTIGEIELLILSACMHDLGMVYTEDEEVQCYQDEKACRKFLYEYCPELLGVKTEEWPESIRQWYLRTLHPFRLYEVLENRAWKELFDRRPLEVLPKQCIIAVCQAHGENVKELINNNELNYLSANDTEPLFCALLLRLSDLLDFDDTRAPKVLYSYVVYNEKSRMEWEKHQSSAGFLYPSSPSTDDLPYKARCTNPGTEHAVRDFLDWIDEELSNCMRLQNYCRREWQRQFPFPRAVLRTEIESDGYVSGDFCVTMDQSQILKLLTGENLYEDSDVFVRELLQNAIDATLLRGELEPNFIPEKSRLDLWEWNDKEGNVWFRIDDYGTGMTLGMLQRYFLKVGNSYYNSKELERDLRDHKQFKKYNGISRFGIGFLSCFLCGDYVEVSTLYFDDNKNRKEEMRAESYQTVHYGLRLQVTGLSGYYTLKSQARHHQAEQELPAPDIDLSSTFRKNEKDGYRSSPGTSIVVRLVPGKLGTVKLHDVVEKYLCGAAVPIYYNNKRIGKTYGEIMQMAHELEGERVYELPENVKKEFDSAFPQACGNYPKIIISVTPLDTVENYMVPELSGIVVKSEIRFDKSTQWKIKDQIYEIAGSISYQGKIVEIELQSRNKTFVSREEWRVLRTEYTAEEVSTLEKTFEKYSLCPRIEDIAEVWKPFEEQRDIYQVWTAYIDTKQEKGVLKWNIEIEQFDSMPLCPNSDNILLVYQGIVAENLVNIIYTREVNNCVVFFFKDTWKPGVNVSRSKVSDLPLITVLAINGILYKYDVLDETGYFLNEFNKLSRRPLRQWKEIEDSQVDKWLKKNLTAFIHNIQKMFQKPCGDIGQDMWLFRQFRNYLILYRYAMAVFQTQYRLVINYEEGQIISFYPGKEDEIDERLDLFPPMMFCIAESEQSRRFLCSADCHIRKGITIDHPFTAWLLDNAAKLKKYYERQFQQIIDCFF